jgi:hypothetical protein
MVQRSYFILLLSGIDDAMFDDGCQSEDAEAEPAAAEILPET